MKSLLFVIGCCVLLGAVGMTIGSRNAPLAVKKSRWLKFSSYLLIVAALLFAIKAGFFFGLAIVITCFGYYELVQVAAPARRKTLALLLYTGLVMGFLYWAGTASSDLKFFTVYLVLIFDAFCQVCGQIWGRRALASRISPSKTVEGLAGGVLCCAAASLFGKNLLQADVITLLFLALTVSASSLGGDLLASYYKRRSGIKDYSTLLPGQGGFLDRFDSLIMTGFVCAWILGFLPRLRF